MKGPTPTCGPWNPRLKNPQTDYALPTTATYQTLEHPHHDESLLSLDLDFLAFAPHVPSHFRCLSVSVRRGLWISSNSMRHSWITMREERTRRQATCPPDSEGQPLRRYLPLRRGWSRQVSERCCGDASRSMEAPGQGRQPSASLCAPWQCPA